VFSTNSFETQGIVGKQELRIKSRVSSELGSSAAVTYLDNLDNMTVGYFEVQVLMGGFYDQVGVGITSDLDYCLSEFVGY